MSIALVISPGIGHDKIRFEFFSTPPQSVTFVIRLPALRTAYWQFSPELGNPVSTSNKYQSKTPIIRWVFYFGDLTGN